MKTILQCTITRKDGSVLNNPLMLKETHLISQMAKYAESVLVVRKQVTNEEFCNMFGLRPTTS